MRAEDPLRVPDLRHSGAALPACDRPFEAFHAEPPTGPRVDDPPLCRHHGGQGELYVFAYDLNGLLRAHPKNPKLIGRNLMDKPDSKGKLFRKEIMDKAKSAGRRIQPYIKTL